MIAIRRSLITTALVLLPFLPVHASSPAATGEWLSPHSIMELAAAPAPLIPYPREARWGSGVWVVPSRVAVAAPNGLKGAQQALAELLRPSGVEVDLTGSGAVMFRFTLDTHAMPKAEGYTLEVSGKEGVTIRCSDSAGAFYAVQTLRQLLLNRGDGVALPACSIRDWPAFGLRGFMHDTGRNFQEIASLKAQMDRLATYKYNTFHWHLTDNPAWRPESRVFPQLNDPKNRTPGRDPEKSYSFEDIRGLIRYAAERHIRVIPELDMPGHSEYFERTFGFKMGSEKGMAVLEKLIDEFCSEISASDCPILHIGSDEVHVPNPQVFMQRMLARVRANGRTPMVWNPGLHGDAGTIEQRWGDEGVTSKRSLAGQPFVDSAAGYLNSGDAFGSVQRYFFHQPCRQPQGDACALGGILCCWPDVRVDDKRNIFLHSPVWPGALAYMEALWNGRATNGSTYFALMPPAGSQAWQFFREFEIRLAAHRDRYFKGEPFPYVQFGQVSWRVVGPFMRGSNEAPDRVFAPEQEIRGHYPEAGRWSSWKDWTGGWLNFRAIVGGKGPYDRMTMYALTYIHCDEARTGHAWLGFETPGRANRRCGGIPPVGEWCAHGGVVFVNDRKLPGPAWKNPGTRRFLKNTWGMPGNEIPYDDEEFYWARGPAVIPLKKGWNKILIRVPCGYSDQNWNVSFMPVHKNEAGRWVEDLSVNPVPRPSAPEK